MGNPHQRRRRPHPPQAPEQGPVMDYGPLVAVLSVVLTALGIGIAIGVALN
jgi:hypothetical protein